MLSSSPLLYSDVRHHGPPPPNHYVGPRRRRSASGRGKPHPCAHRPPANGISEKPGPPPGAATVRPGPGGSRHAASRHHPAVPARGVDRAVPGRATGPLVRELSPLAHTRAVRRPLRAQRRRCRPRYRVAARAGFPDTGGRPRPSLDHFQRDGGPGRPRLPHADSPLPGGRQDALRQRHRPGGPGGAGRGGQRDFRPQRLPLAAAARGPAAHARLQHRQRPLPGARRHRDHIQHTPAVRRRHRRHRAVAGGGRRIAHQFVGSAVVPKQIRAGEERPPAGADGTGRASTTTPSSKPTSTWSGPARWRATPTSSMCTPPT